MSKIIRGAGGGGGKSGGGSSHTPTETPDSLRSRQYARVIDVVSEGEIGGLVNGLKSVFLDDTPAMGSDGTRNFSGMALVERVGTQSQSYIPGFPAVEAEVAVATEVTYATPVVRSISNVNASAVRVTLSIPQLTYQDPANGDLRGSSVSIAIDVNTNGAGYVPCRLRIAQTTLAMTGATANSGATQINRAELTMDWTCPISYTIYGEVDTTPKYCYWRLDYKASGGAWTQFATGVLSGSATLVSTWSEIGSTYVETWVAPSGSVTREVDLTEDTYEFRAVMTSGSGSVTLSRAEAWAWVNNDIITGKTTSRYQRAYRVELSGGGPWDIRVRRLTADSTQVNLRNATWWDSYTEIIDAKLSYPNSALVAVAVDAEQFHNIPRRGYEIYGLKVQIPSNYDPVTRVYTGVWDGTFQVAWTDNPAWCFYDLLTNDRYGLGAFLDAAQIDKWSLYTIAQYCDELVSNGFGGQEPRFTCNLYLQTREEAYKVIGSMASIFRGMVYWAGGAVVPVQDAPADVAALFTAANVIEGQFQYQGSGAKARHTVCLVAWNDPADRYRQKIEYVEDAEGIARYGVIQSEILAVGCTSRGQAHRLGRWLLYTERMECETVTFRTGLDGLVVAPGDIIQTSDPVRAGVRVGGRIVTGAVDEVTVDSAVTISAGKTYTLWAVLPDGTVESRTVTNAPGSATVLTVAPDFSSAPQAYSVWVLAANDLVPETWRVVAVMEADGTQAEITALAYNSQKYDLVENDLNLEPLLTSSLSAAPAPPTDVETTESLYLVTHTVVGARVVVSWRGATPRYELEWRCGDGNYSTINTASCSADIQPADAGVYGFRLVAINALGRRSTPVVWSQTIYGLTAAPSNVSGFALTALGGSAHLSWAPSADLDVIVGGYMRIRHTPDTATPDWSSAVDIGAQIPGTATNSVLPLIAGTYLAKWVDSTGNESATATGIITDAPSLMALNVVETLAESPTFLGAKTSVHLSSLGLTLDSAETIGEQLDPVSEWPRLSALGGIATSGTYLFDGSVDLGGVQTARLTAVLQSVGIDALDLISERPLVSTWPSVGGDLITDVSARLYVRTTADDPKGAPTWSAWQEFAVGDYSARGFEFRLDLATSYATHNVVVTSLSVTVDMPDRVESGEDIVSGAGAYRVTYVLPFMAAPAVGITAQDMATGDFYQISNKDEEGFDIVFKNAGGSAVSRTFDFMAKGY